MAIKSLAKNKVHGPDIYEISAEMLKLGQGYIEQLVALFNDIFRKQEITSDWINGITVKLPKKGSLSDCDNCRGIALRQHLERSLHECCSIDYKML